MSRTAPARQAPKVTQHHGVTGAPYEIIEVPNRLAAKAGNFRADHASGVSAIAEIAKIAQGYPDSIRGEVERLRVLWLELQAAPDPDRERQFQAIAQEFRAQAPAFGYDLVGAIAGSLCIMIEAKALRRTNAFPAIEAHVDALAAVLKLALKGDGGKPGREVIERLRDAVLSATRKAA
jgi:hypothetical protein